ncbi:MAG: hypothetical protein WAN14_19310 [Candidatus Acidiferrales bacterium]
MTIRELIERQRRFARSGDILERVVGTLYQASVLGKRLAELSDRQVGQLLTDIVGDRLTVSGPETTICQQATLRLFRSPAGQLTSVASKQPIVCPRCGSHMLQVFGIHEPDYQECILIACGLRIPV